MKPNSQYFEKKFTLIGDRTEHRPGAMSRTHYTFGYRGVASSWTGFTVIHDVTMDPKAQRALVKRQAKWRADGDFVTLSKLVKDDAMS